MRRLTYLTTIGLAAMMALLFGASAYTKSVSLGRGETPLNLRETPQSQSFSVRAAADDEDSAVPSAPTNVQAEETSNPGEVTITWDAPTTDTDGNALTGNLYYVVMEVSADGTTKYLAQKLTTSSYTYSTGNVDGAPEFKVYGVFAIGDLGIGETGISNSVPLGMPYSVPFKESFVDGLMQNAMSVKTFQGYVNWVIYSDGTLDGIYASDEDNGYAGSYATFLNDQAIIYTAKLNLDANSNPKISFYSYNLYDSSVGNDQNELRVMVSTDNGKTFNTVDTFIMGSVGNTEGWYKFSTSLADYAGQTVLVGIASTCKTYSFTIIDNIVIKNGANCNLTANRVVVPTSAVEPGDEYEVKVEIENTGIDDVESYYVDLYKNNTLYETKECGALETSSITSVKFKDTATLFGGEQISYRAEVRCEDDGDEEDNTTRDYTVNVTLPLYPTVTNLKGFQKDGMASLTWVAPDTSGDGSVTETFESYDSFSTNVGDWTLYDGDKAYIGGINGITIPNISDGSTQSYWVMDSSYDDFNNSYFTAHSGTKYLAQCYSYTGTSAVTCNDWVISPKLTGEAQTISLYARSFDSDYAESFQLMYSTGGKTISEFKQLEKKTSVPSSWTEYTFDLPEGTNYFAVRCISYDCFMFFVDDITYTPAGSGKVELQGYNVYCDGEKINEELISTEEYTAAGSPGKHLYSVTAVYDKGESRGVSTYITLSGIDSAMQDDAEVVVDQRVVRISNPTGTVLISDIAGKVVYHSTSAADVEVELNSGVYILKVGNMTRKLIIK